MLLLIDNYDSFSHNLARYFRQLGQGVRLVRNDEVSLPEIRDWNPQAIVLSPGPGTPREAGIGLSLVREMHKLIPLLGVCLGHQTICEALGGRIIRAHPVHGRPAAVQHNGHPVFEGVSTPFVAGRYHSLTVEPESVPESLRVVATLTAAGDDKCEPGLSVMAVAHRQYPVVGFQFHPESVLTRVGYRLLANFLNLAGIGSIPRTDPVHVPGTAVGSPCFVPRQHRLPATPDQP